MSEDEYTPRERGLLIGSEWARECRAHGVVARDEEGGEYDPVTEAARETPNIPEDMAR